MDKLNLDRHISRQFNAELEALRTQMLEMGGLVEQQVSDAVAAIESGDTALAEKVIVNEDKVDEFELELDEQATLVLARRQPAASDLRLVLAVIKAIRDLERIGDEAQKVAKMAIELSGAGTNSRGASELRHIGASVAAMMNQGLDAFARFDADAALKVVEADKLVDREYKTAMRELVTYMMEDPREISRVMNVLWALRALERIGDHVRNICEHVIYLVRGLDIRHISLDEAEAKLHSKKP
ncbi:phosphate signaling complex protein PhoU [Simiduia curdlanivorans]|uniref:Phosphate-specific transport system accessory protein PhoU n=1 Tax=Simiduia curdlanivorans TaxID=1492769 RepID=A0ABV8V2F6_9GAMM|nr:phosphate signaling complex protein PhoU [Simiduia curdlanivorans]MDN3637957.1 phosphate signaling complex protein PhoU [Simiduia curdlanivorans]